MSFWVKAEEVPLYIQEIIFTKLEAIDGCYLYKLRGTPGGTSNTYESAAAALEKLTEWCKRVGADVTVKRNGFEGFYSVSKKNRKNVKYMRYTLEITDPASKAIDELIEKYRKHWDSPPQDRMEWERYREKEGI